MTDYRFSKRSLENLKQTHNDIQNSVRLALEWQIMDFAVTEGHRGKAAQDRFYSLGKSKVKFPDSKHNIKPSDAVDIVPVIDGQVSWGRLHCIHLAGVILSAGRCLGIELRWGGNWDKDGEPVTDQYFQDLVHYERV